MTGIAGGTVDQTQLGRMLDALEHEDWYTSDRFEAGEYGLGSQHHGEKDSAGHAFWTDGQVAGAIDGAISNLDALGWDMTTVFERFSRAPERTLATLEGGFNIAVVDASADRVLLGMDKIGCRPCYYTTTDGFAFGTELTALLEVIEEPTVDIQGISDLLLMGNMWSDTTLLESVKALRPATVLEYRDNELSQHRYWQPDYEPSKPSDEYLFDLTKAFQRSVDRASTAMSGDVGVWLSGGLDSRITASELARNRDAFDSLVAYTYDANPGGGINPALAERVTEELQLPIETVPLDCERFRSVLTRAVNLTDGMVRWKTLVNLSAIFNIQRYEPDVLMEGLFGIGHHLCQHHLTNPSSLVESMYQSEAVMPKETVEELLDVSVDPLGSFRAEAQRIDTGSLERGIIDAHFQNYFARSAHANNHLARSQVGTRVPYADGEFLSQLAKLPPSYRMGSLPFSDGDLIYGITKPKLRIIRSLNDGLAQIPYERSRLKPSLPFPAHVCGFYATTALSRLMSKPTYAGTSMEGKWYRNDDDFRQLLDDLIDSACERPFFDGDALRDRRQRHLDGSADEMDALSAVTTVEIWLRENLD